MAEFEIAGVEYSSGKLNAFQQLHLSRRLAPIIPKLLPAFLGLQGVKVGDKFTTDLPKLADALEPFAEEIARMPEADVDYIIGLTMSVVRRKQGPTWVRIWNDAAKVLQFDDIELPTLIEICVKVIVDNLGPFMAGFAGKIPTADPEVTQ